MFFKNICFRFYPFFECNIIVYFLVSIYFNIFLIYYTYHSMYQRFCMENEMNF